MIFNTVIQAAGSGGGELHTVTAPEEGIWANGYEDGEYVGKSEVSSASFPSGVSVVYANYSRLENVEVACEEYPDGGFTEVITMEDDTYGGLVTFMMPPFDCWIIGE